MCPLPRGSSHRSSQRSNSRRERAASCVSGAETLKALGKVGFVQVSQRGSHVKLRHEDGRTAIVPLYSELARGTLRSILRQAGITPEDFATLV